MLIVKSLFNMANTAAARLYHGRGIMEMLSWKCRGQLGLSVNLTRASKRWPPMLRPNVDVFYVRSPPGHNRRRREQSRLIHKSEFTHWEVNTREFAADKSSRFLYIDALNSRWFIRAIYVPNIYLGKFSEWFRMDFRLNSFSRPQISFSIWRKTARDVRSGIVLIFIPDN